MIEGIEVQCPWCGETIVIVLDPSEGDHTRIEDCTVCCAPLEVTVSTDARGGTAVGVRRDND